MMERWCEVMFQKVCPQWQTICGSYEFILVMQTRGRQEKSFTALQYSHLVCPVFPGGRSFQPVMTPRRPVGHFVLLKNFMKRENAHHATPDQGGTFTVRSSTSSSV